MILYSNEVEISLPVPHEILSAFQTPKDQDDSSGDDALDDGTPARELLLVAERIIPTPSEAEQSGIVKLSLKSIFSKLQTIPEDQQLDVIVAETDVMEEGTLQGVYNTEAKPAETYSESESLGNVEKEDHAFGDEHIIAVANESDRDATPNDALDQAPGDFTGEDDVYSELVGELDAAIFKDLGEIVSEKESLVKSEEVDEVESQPLIAEKADEVELEMASNVEGDPFVLGNTQDDNSSLNQPSELEVGSSNETPQVPNHGDDSCHATVYEQPEKVSNLNDGTEAYEKDKNFDKQSDFEFWDQDEKQHDEGLTKEDDFTPKEQNEISGQENVTEAEKEDFEDGNQPDHLEHVVNDVKGQEDETRENSSCLGTTDGVIPEMNEKDNSGNEGLSTALGGLESVEDGSARKSVDSEECEADEKNTQVSQETTSVCSEHLSGGSEDNDNNNVREPAKRNMEHEPDVKLQSENLKAVVAETVQGSDEAPNNVFMAKNGDTSPKETNDAEGGSGSVGWCREGDKSNEFFPSENGVCDGDRTLGRKAETEEPRIEDVGLHEPFEKETESISGFVDMGDLTDKTSGGATMEKEKPMKDGLLEETWSASSSCGSVKNDENKTNGIETTEMPTFEEGDLKVDALLLPRGSMEYDEGCTFDSENPYSESEECRAGEKDIIQGEVYSTVTSVRSRKNVNL